MSANEKELSAIADDYSLFHRLEQARNALRPVTLPDETQIESARLQLLPLRPQDVPPKFRCTLEWIQSNGPSDSDDDQSNGGCSIEEYTRRTLCFIDDLLSWREENR